MRQILAAAALLLSAALPSAQAAEGPVIACDTLVGLRLLMANGDRDAAMARLASYPGCRTVTRDRVGAAESRAMVGGSPFECLTIKDEGKCAWVLP
ncbi:hypothetical protein G3T14_16630 [Methylobacterium sp. BTF04]|uniref:hypothetical protein n=1 Tax=Methylobacterium sp. BTF04 TaxID=2708300 RepID=UPI0013D36B7E|nr:hypothetical protein [Methylobacterium sp. BTF04]NEU13746.1 hypothetical protein [Methylobacterium sp. BTF04]